MPSSLHSADSHAQDSPQLDSPNYSLDLNQNVIGGLRVLTVSCTYNGVVGFSIIAFSPNISFLSIGLTNGEVVLTVNTSVLEVREYSVSIACFDQNDPSIQDISILTVSRIEENQFNPSFLHSSPLAVSVSESRDIIANPFLVDINATDSDIGSFGTISYGINTPNTDVFAISAETGVISLVSNLDYEDIDIYQFIVTATNPIDQESGIIRSAELVLIVEVVNFNDVGPVFTAPIYQVMVSEAVLLRDSFLQVQCTDGDNSADEISYNIDEAIAGPFSINSTTGELFITQELDYESQTSHTFEVSCVDTGPIQFTSTASVVVTVAPVNEYPPVATHTAASTDFIVEGESIGSVVLSGSVFIVSDRDAGPDGNIYFSINIKGYGAQLLGINSTTGDISVINTIDLDSTGEPFQIIQLSVTVCDTQPPRNECPINFANFVFYIFQAADELPTFSQDTYQASVLESTTLETSVVLASCVDNDRGIGAFKLIEFLNPTQEVLDTFSLNSASGLIQTSSHLDYEYRQNFTFQLRCVDSANFEDSATVQVIVLGDNDNSPTFGQEEYHFNVTQTALVGPFGSVFASDSDLGIGSELSYLAEQNNYFNISTTGTVEVISSLLSLPPDFQITFSVMVTDGTFVANATVIVMVTPGNLNAPVFESRSVSLELNELIAVGTRITTVLCRDSDTGVNAEIFYSIIGGNIDTDFGINSQNGDITVERALVLPQNDTSVTYSVLVECRDGGIPRLFDEIYVLIRVHRIVSSFPDIANSSLTAFIAEDASINDIVTTVEAAYLDLDSRHLRFRLENESMSGAFLIDPSTGTVTVASALDRESVSEYQMTIVLAEVSQILGPELSDQAQLTIYVRDVNDNGPTCDTSIHVATLSENTLVNTSILQLSCTDPDINENGQIHYSLSNSYEILTISSSTGEITLMNPIDDSIPNTIVTTVAVSDLGEPQRMVTYQITLFIIQTNQYAPTFLNLPRNISLSEATLIQELVFVVQAFDLDRGSNGQFNFQITPSVDAFIIIPNTGEIYLTQKLSFYQTPTYSLNIAASDGDLVTNELLTVFVQDVNEHAPQCDSTLLTVTIPEGVESNQTAPIMLLCSDGDEGSNGAIVYSIADGNINGTFEISDDGSITLQRVLDYEQVREYNLLVMAADGGNPSLSSNLTISVAVSPRNEYPPVFDQLTYNVAIPEDSQVGSIVVLQVTATDEDVSPEGMIQYSLNGLSEPLFGINDTGAIKLLGNLDREVTSLFSFSVVASDSDQPPKSASASIEISVTDVDDNPPQFTQPIYFRTLNLTTQVGSPVVQVNCTDPDIGVNALVRYSLDDSADSRYFEVASDTGMVLVRESLPLSKVYTFTLSCTGLGPVQFSDTAVVSVETLIENTVMFLEVDAYNLSIPEDLIVISILIDVNASSETGSPLSYSLLDQGIPFSIDAITGVLFLVASLDYETQTSYALRVQAKDVGNPPNTAQTVVQIFVENVNDAQPQILTTPSALQIQEGVPGPIVIGNYDCRDADGSPQNQTIFIITSGDDQGLFAISASGVLQLIGELDYETAQSYRLTLECRDGGEPVQTANIVVPISVIPVNEHSPVFSMPEYTVTISEDIPPNTQIDMPIQATDADLPPHGDLTYSISDGPLTISVLTGQLLLSQPLDYESTSVYVLSVLAVDSGDPALSSTASVIVMVNDVNDNSPQFSAPFYFGTIGETAQMGSEVLLDSHISCADNDSNANGQVSLAIVDGNTDNVFSIQATAPHLITVTKPLNFEEVGIYYLTVECSDGGSTPLISQATVVVSVSAINEFGPMFGNLTYVFEVSESASIGTEIGVVEAIDDDLGEHGVITYSLINATDVPFVLDSSTGSVRVARSLDYETQQQMYVLGVAATDNSTMSDRATIIIQLLNENDNLPVFSQSNYYVSISENISPGSVVTEVICADGDNMAAGIPVRYDILQADVPFNVDGGLVRVSTGLDLEQISMYALNIRCTDSDGSAVEAILTIHLEPYNDFEPLFTGSLPYTVELSENQPLGLSIFQVTALDDDVILYNDITFNITSSNDDGVFEIDPATGIVSVAQVIDREQQSSYVLDIEARNVIPPGDTSGSPSLFSTTSLVITVLDLNDNKPIIIPDQLTAFISQSNTVVVEFVCSDPDLDLNGDTTLSITSNNTASSFKLYENGTLLATEFLGVDAIVEVTCSDSGNPPLASTATIIVSPTSMNDHQPTFSQASYTLVVNEDAPVGQEIECYQATDNDGSETPDGLIRYSLIPLSMGTSRFSINSDTGCVFTSIALDISSQSVYEYTLMATDMGNPPLSGSAILIVTVNSVAGNVPFFIGEPFTRIISEGVESNTGIVTLSCDDPDNENLTYSIIGESDDLFVIGLDSGIVSIAPNQRLDYEQSTSHTLSVQCIDPLGFADTAEVFITVTPVNEFTPTLQEETGSISEHSIVGTPVVQLEWMDGDDGLDGDVIFEIASGSDNNEFIVTSNGLLLVGGLIDRESTEFYSLEIGISDLSSDLSSRRSSVSTVNITILDINDNTPQFGAQLYTFGPLEGNEEPGFVVGNVSCEDADINANADLSYIQLSAENNATSLYTINASTGIIALSGDIESRDSDTMSFVVQCMDNGIIPLSSSAIVFISIVEVNRQAPMFTNSTYRTSVLEEEVRDNTSLLTVLAEDADAGAGGEVRYYLANSSITEFSIDENTGELFLLEPLDYESQQNYTLTVLAIDGADDSLVRLTSTASVFIEVLAINDHGPVCFDTLYSLTINESTQGALVDLKCNDADVGIDGELTYTITDTNAVAGTFVVDSLGTVILTAPIPPDDSSEQYFVLVTVSDLSIPTRMTDIRVEIVYSFEDQSPPAFSQANYTFTVSELVPVGQIVAVINATDPDPGLQGELTFSIVGTSAFKIGSSSGEVYVSEPLDYELWSVEQFQVIVQDSDPVSPLFTAANVTAYVQNENDTAPDCPLSFYDMSLLSTVEVGSSIVSLGCSDPDYVGSLEFELVGGKRRQISPFAINETTGQVYVVESLVPSTTYTFNVRVMDNSGDTKEITVSVAVRFSNMVPPVFQRAEYSFSVHEDASLLSSVGSVEATDSDSGDSNIIYTLLSHEELPEFYVHPTTGDVLVTAPLDYETQVAYSFIIQAKDTGSFDGTNRLSATTSVTVIVSNSNDNAPTFNSEVYAASVTSASKAGDVLVDIRCTDADAFPFGSPMVAITGVDSLDESPDPPNHSSGDGSGASTSLNPVTDLFQLNAINISEGLWKIELLQHTEQPGVYLIDIACTDGGNLTSSREVYIFVPDELSPQFSQAMYEWRINENSVTASQYSLLRATAASGMTVQYEFSAGNTDGAFYIQPSTGVVTLLRKLDYEAQTIHTLITTATDSNMRQSGALLLVRVLDTFDELPQYSPPMPVFQVQQNIQPGVPIGVVNCDDADSSAMLNITMISPTDLFSIDQYGIVRVTGVLNYRSLHTFSVSCYNVMMLSLATTTTVIIETTFSNNYAPLFELDSYTFSVDENTTLFSVIGSVQAIDNDVGSYGRVTYSITEGDREMFYVDPTTGSISLLSPLDYESAVMHQVTIRAYDCGNAQCSNRMASSTLVSVFVQDVNDVAPAFAEQSYAQELFSNQTILSPALTVECLDPEQEENGEITYSLGVDNSDFIIQRNGTILLAKQQLSQTTETFEVVCSDRGNSRLSSSVLIIVIVNGDPSESFLPIFESPYYQVSVPEDSSVFMSLVRVHADILTTETSVVYSIESGNDGNYFYIDPTLGDLILTDSLLTTGLFLHNLIIKASTALPTAFFSFASVEVDVVRTRRNPPSFSSPFYYATITENAQLFTPVAYTMCSIQDGAAITYEVASTRNLAVPFNITQMGVVVVAGPLDYEDQVVHILTITCREDSANSSASARLRIEVEPQNEYAPSFSRSLYSFSAVEDSFGLSVGQVHAQDGDAGSQGEVTYQLIESADTSRVLLEPSTGEIIIADNLDYEQQPFLLFSVSASDVTGRESIAIVTINVSNINDEFPVIDPSTAIVTIASDSPPGYPLLFYECIDADGSDVNISILTGNELGYFDLNNMNQLIWTNNTEGLSSDVVVSLSVQCYDIDAPTQVVLARVAITVQQELQIQPPVFSEDFYNTSIPETAQVNSPVLVLSASGPNTEIEFSIYNPPDNYPFAVNADGAVILILSLLYDTTRLYLFTVQATDSVTGEFDLALVQIVIEDVMDVPPIIFPTHITTILPEDTGTGSIIATYVCRDGDTGATDEVSLRISSGNTNTTFSLNSSGSITLVKNLNFEMIASFNLTVTCLDGGNARFSTNATLIVHVTGVNEYAPEFSQQQYSFTVSEDELARMAVGSVFATDRDRGRDGDVQYEVVGGSGEDYFTLNAIGEIHTTARPLNASETPSLELAIIAIDPGSLYDSSTVIVHVADVNERPEFLVDSIAVIPLLPSPSPTILEFACYDVDVENNAELTLSISYNPSNLDVYLGAVSGTGFLASSIIMNSTLPTGTHELGLTCTDYGNPPLHSNATVAIRVEGSNTPPTFVHGTVTVSVREDTPVTTLITMVNATDAESGVIYEIASGNGLGTFSINTQTGDIYLALPLDFEVTPNYMINIFAHDLATTNPLLDSVEVIVLIDNTNDIAPLLTPPGTQVISLSENTPTPQDILTYTCTDEDGGSISFTFVSAENPTPFSLLPVSEFVVTLRLMHPLDYEVQTLYTLLVTCTDSPIQREDASRQVSATILVHIRPENNYAPQFISPALFRVGEDVGIGQVVARVQAVDRDNRTQVTYFTASHTDIFSVDQSSGSITLRQQLDFESVSVYTLSMQASDGDFTDGVEPRIASTQVTIEVTDANDHFPVCSTYIHNVSLPTGSYSYISLLNLTCSDVDSGLNGLLAYTIDSVSLSTDTNGSFVINGTTGEFGFTGTVIMPGTTVIDVLVADSGNVSLSTAVSIIVEVDTSDVDLPRFSPSVFTVTISEDTPSQSTILDGSILVNALHNPFQSSVRFALHPNPLHLNAFIINIATGDLILTSSNQIDFDEGIKEYELLIQATLGDYMAIAVVSIVLTDVNDNPPTFFQSTYTGSVLENKPSGTFVLRVQATDIDTSQNRMFRYSLENALSFDVNSVTGEITTLGIIDREMLPVASFVISATDSGSPPMTGTALVTITILDENDNPPQFDSPLYTVTIHSQSTPGVLTTLSVSDLDSNSVANFRIVSSDPTVTELFSVESPSGNLIQKWPITSDLFASEYTFTVEVSDGIANDSTAVVVHIAQITFTTIVFEENTVSDILHLPSFLQQQQFNLSSNATYTITSGNDDRHFDITYPDGTLVVQRALNREQTPQYNLIIGIFDSTAALENINLTVSLIVSDQNDNAPIFTNTSYFFAISEGSFITPMFIGTILATDYDQEGTVNSIVRYSLINSPPIININEATGEVFAQGTLDHEFFTSVLNISVRAHDLGQPSPLVSYAILLIEITDVNDNDPRFVPFDVVKFTVLIEEGTQAGTQLNTIIGHLLSGSSVTLSAFEYTDPDSSSMIVSSLVLIRGENKFRLESVAGDPNRQVLVATSSIDQADTETILQLIIRDEPEDVEQSPIRKNVTISVVSVLTSPTSSTSTTNPSGTTNPFMSATIALVIVLLISIVIIVVFVIVVAFIYLQSRGKNSSYCIDRM